MHTRYGDSVQLIDLFSGVAACRGGGGDIITVTVRITVTVTVTVAVTGTVTVTVTVTVTATVNVTVTGTVTCYRCPNDYRCCCCF